MRIDKIVVNASPLITLFRSGQAGLLPQMHYAIVIENAENNFSAYVPDLPGCVATGAAVEEAESQIREAIEFHLDGMREDGIAIPQPASRAEYVEIAA